MGKKNKNQKNKNSITFRLVSRSQHDPLINYEDAPQAVLVEEKKTKEHKSEQIKYGIYYDDDYDYLQHLKGVKEDDYFFEEFDPKGSRIKEIKSKNEIDKENDIIKLPSSVFPSQYQENVGMLNKAVLPKGIRPDWDQDVIEQLYDDDLDLEDKNNVLDDDFVIQAMEGQIKPCNDDKELNNKKNRVKFEDEFNDISSDDDKEDDRHTFRTIGSKTEFTNYSLTSSVIRRNEKLNDLDEHFENFFLKDIAEEYNENDEQQNSDSEIENVDQNILDSLINEHKKNKNKLDYHTELPKETIIKIAEQQQLDEENNIEELEQVELRLATGKNEFEDRWDCETILSNYTNIYNRPKLIVEEKSNKIKLNKFGIAEENNKLTEKNLKQFNKEDDKESIRTITSIISQLSIRNKDETKEEKQKRKKNLKEYMKERRQEKKANKLAFKDEERRINKEKVINPQLVSMKF